MSQPANDAADEPERRLFFEQLSARYAVLRADPDAWSEIEAERDATASASRSTSEQIHTDRRPAQAHKQRSSAS